MSYSPASYNYSVHAPSYKISISGIISGLFTAVCRTVVIQQAVVGGGLEVLCG